MPRHVLFLALLACRTDKIEEETGEPVAGGADDSASAETADTGETGDTDDTGESGWMKSNCPDEAPPTPFTGGLVYLAWALPDGGAYAVPYEDYVVTEEAGVVDWAAGTISTTTAYVPGYTTVSSTLDASFTIEANGDYLAQTTQTRTALDGTTVAFDALVTKTGCVTVTESTIPETGETSVGVAELVSTDTFLVSTTTSNDEGGGWTYTSTGTRTADWTTEYTFETDDPATTVDPDREGWCSNDAAGTTLCEMSLYYDAGTREEISSTWWYDGDWTNDWAWYDPTADHSPASWGTRSGDYWGAQEATWYTYDDDGNVVTCSGAWDADGEGAWSCSDGSSG